MHRNNLREKLIKYASTYASEIEDKAKMLAFLDANKDCFERFCEIGHFTGSCWIENSDGTKFLLTLHKKIGLWLQLGGHADGDSDLVRVALREAHEESGLKSIKLLSADIFDISLHRYVATCDKTSGHYHYDIRFLLKAEDDEIHISGESSDLKWFDEPPLNDPKLGTDVVRMFEKWKQWQKA